MSLPDNSGSPVTAKSRAPCPSEPTEHEIHLKPWKYIGYKGYAKFVSSTNDFFIFRQFSALNARVALLLQDQISVLEGTLDELDRKYSAKDFKDLHNGRFRNDEDDRAKVLETLTEKLKQYNDFILQQSKLRSLEEAPDRNIKSVRNWHYNHDYCAISADEQKYLEHDKDLISVSPSEPNPINDLIKNSLRLRALPLWRHQEDEVPNYDAGNVTYYSPKRIDRFASVVITLIGAVMFIAPIWTLQALVNLKSKLAVITVFVSVLLVAVSNIMVTKPHEALAITAAYAAVLMVFVQFGTTD